MIRKLAMLGLGQFLWVLLALSAAPVAAHLSPNSEVDLTIRDDAVTADIVVPQGEYAYATGNPVSSDPAAIDLARQYLASHFSVRSGHGKPWTVAIQTVEFKQIAGPPDLHATARLTPPRGDDTRKFTVQWSVLLNELPSHFALFVLTEDHGTMVGEGRTILGALRAGNTKIEVERGEARTRLVLVNAVIVGMHHILGGYDHLLFLFALLLPAPLIARQGRWSSPRPMRETVVHLARTVTAFTIGHSLTLIGATMGGWHLPTDPVEVAIAVSVLVSAIHAIRPLFPGREHYVALAFGLVHGLAFATLLSNTGAGAASTATGLLGFNLGIEIVQLGIVAAVVPALLILAQTRWFSILRTLLGTAAAAIAMAWIADRSLGLGNGLVDHIDVVVSHSQWALAALYVFAIPAAVGLLSRRRAGTTPLTAQSR